MIMKKIKKIKKIEKTRKMKKMENEYEKKWKTKMKKGKMKGEGKEAD